MTLFLHSSRTRVWTLLLLVCCCVQVIVVVEAAGTSYGSMNSCNEQGSCLQVTVNEFIPKCGSHTCEYEVCWRQLSGGSTTNNGSSCGKYGDVQYIGDMHRSGDAETTVEGGCLNEENDAGRGYWDSTCTDPENVYSNGVAYQSFFHGICQIVAPGHTAHLLINDGASCSGTATIDEATGLDTDGTGTGLTATCLPSTEDPYSATGQTYFPGSKGPGGTCSGEPEGYDCVWAITVPSSCAYEEGDYTCYTEINRNDQDVCPNADGSSVLKYYEHDKNGPPPQVPIHDITLNGNGTVSFRVVNPFGDDLHDLYTIYQDATTNGNNEECNKEDNADTCSSPKVLTAQCLDDGTYAVVTIFAAGFDSDSGAAGLVNDGSDGDGSDIYDCCPKTFEPADHLRPKYTASWTYVLFCQCPQNDDETPNRRHRSLFLKKNDGLDANELTERFQRGELFDEATKRHYGLVD
eukprot:scaffold5166_cov152-Cylindrotheca_fusiformis.AAC.3